MLCGLLVPDGGSGTCLGRDMTQKFRFYEDLTVFENLTLVASVYQIANQRDSVFDIMNRMGLAAHRDQLAGQLSCGWKQRLALVRC